MTNGDRIRQMSDQELARFISHGVPKCVTLCNDSRLGCGRTCKHRRGENLILIWLQEESKEEQQDG